jgi:redox-sensitive bicupin YhaK (pirin superfamily)
VRTHSSLFYAHLDMASGAKAALPDENLERAIYVAAGAVQVAGERHEAGAMLVMASGPSDGFTALEPSVVMLLGGEPLGERFLYWNFVFSSQERIEQAKADWKAGRMKLPDLDQNEFIPLPEEPTPSPNPMS